MRGWRAIAVASVLAAILGAPAASSAAQPGGALPDRLPGTASPGHSRPGPPRLPQQCDLAYERYDACYDYAGSSDTEPDQGAAVSFPVAAPILGADQGHTLMELAVFNRTPAGIDQDTAEIGWIVDSQRSGQRPIPHLFVYHFVNTRGTCYDGCGFVSTSARIKPGMALRPGLRVRWAIHNLDGRWTFFFNGREIGYIPDAAYQGTFTDAVKVNVYGEIAGDGLTPGCAQMGDGLFGSQPGAETISGLHLFGAARQPGLLREHPTDGAAWNSAKVGGALRVGGPGDCLPVAGTVAGPRGGYTVVGRDGTPYRFAADRNPWARPALRSGVLTSTAPAAFIAVARDPATGGHWTMDDQGDVVATHAPAYGGLNGVGTRTPVVAIAAVGSGYVIVTAGGAVTGFHAPTWGGLHGRRLSSPIVSATASGTGYLLAAADGTVYPVHTTVPRDRVRLPGRVTAIAGDGRGYLVVDDRGDVAAVGTPDRGSLRGHPLAEPIIAITPTGRGYVLTDAIGGVDAFHTRFNGSVTNEGV